MLITKRVTKPKMTTQETLTLTFGNRAENHIGNESIGDDTIIEGLSYDDFMRVKEQYGDRVEIIDLKKLLSDDMPVGTEDAYLLVIRGGVDLLMGDGSTSIVQQELESKEVDKKFYNARTKKVLNKHARYNYCISDFERLEPDYESGKGRVYNFANMPATQNLRTKIGEVFGEKCVGLQGEINKYYDVSKCGIGWHGDKEREIVIGTRFGADFPIAFQWFHRGEKRGERLILNLKSGDLYAMSAKTVGKDWMSPSKYTLRHCAGCDKYMNAK